MTTTVESPSDLSEIEQFKLTHRYFAIPRQMLRDARPRPLVLQLGKNEDKTPRNRVELGGDCHILALANQFAIGIPIASELEAALGADVANGFRGRGSHAIMVAALQLLIDQPASV